MLHTKFHYISQLVPEKKIFNGFRSYMGHGGHIGHVTKLIIINSHFLVPVLKKFSYESLFFISK